MAYEIKIEKQTIHFFGRLNKRAMRPFCSALHKTVSQLGYRDVILDFSQAESVFEAFMVPVLPLVRHYNTASRVDFLLELPKEQRLRRLFKNTNWAHFLCPRRFEQTGFKSGLHMPVVNFLTGDEQYSAVNNIMEVLVGALSGIERGHLKALEWSINEVTDNVLNHAESEVGGFVQATTFSEAKKVEVIVSDAGIGIPKSMNDGQRQEDAVRRSIDEGVTRNKETNRGNGLFGTFQIASLSQGEFEINSQNVCLYLSEDEVHVPNVPIPYRGTSVRFVVDCNEPDLLAKALKFKGEAYEPSADYIEMKYEQEGSEDLVIRITENAQYLASRESGKILKNKIHNLLESCPIGRKVIVDFSGIYVLSSSVADEVFGMLFKELGPMRFMSRIEIAHADHTVQALIDRSIQSRMLDPDHE